jgi:hypothetical protein
VRLHSQLIEQAHHLAARERRKPRQASLRRAVSTAYYALFHFLIDEACRLVFGTAHNRRHLRFALSRAFDHGAMKAASKSFAGGTLPATFDWKLPIPADLSFVADTFIALQEERHDADYNLARSFRREEAVVVIASVEQCFALWPTIQNDDSTRLYLVSLLAWGARKAR